MDFPLKQVAFYLDYGKVRSGHLVKVTEPQEDDDENAKTLYEFGHGFSTSEVFKTEEDAQAALDQKDAGNVA